jgi:quinohemoprotein ethanol dehydrogenase
MKQHGLKLALTGLLMALAMAAGPGTSSSRPLKPVGADWLRHNATDMGGNFSPLGQISTATVGKLGLAWSIDLPDEHALEATPLAVNGILYFSGSYARVYAVDGRTGKRLWMYDPETWKHNQIKLRWTLAANRGVAYEAGRIFVGTIDGRLIALDARTGKKIWSVETVDPDSKNTITGAPAVFRGKVLIGNGGADFNARGYVTAYDQKTGKQLWRFYTVPGSPEQNKGDPAMERAAETWSGEYWKTGTGGTAWNGLTYDPELNQVYIGTGNSGPYDPAVRSPGNGDNLYLVSIVALNPDTGEYIWHYQQNPREAWDYKSTPNIIATTLTIDGKPRKVLLHAPTNGFMYVLDRVTGKVISAEKITRVSWAKSIDLNTGRPVELPNIRYETGETSIWPGTFGGHNWMDMAFSPKTGLVYVPVMQLGVTFRKFSGTGGVTTSGIEVDAIGKDVDPDAYTGTLLAWDPVRQKARWKVLHDVMWNGGILATQGNLVFQGTADGWLSGYDSASGKRLWRFYVGMGIIAPPMSYAVGGRQYVSVLAGFGNSNIVGYKNMDMGWKYASPRRLLTFALGGTAKLPKTPPRWQKLKPVDDPKLVLDEAQVAAGDRLFNMNCWSCHGLKIHSTGGFAPDLRESLIALDKDALWGVLHEGALLPNGMPRFDSFTREQSDAIHAYIRAGAREALGLRKPKKDDAKRETRS